MPVQTLTLTHLLMSLIDERALGTNVSNVSVCDHPTFLLCKRICELISFHPA